MKAGKSSEKANKQTNSKPIKIRQSKLALFIKVFLLTTAVLAIVTVSVLAFLDNWIKPPVIPPDDAEHALIVPDLGDLAFLPAEGDEEDMYIGNGLRSPEGFTADDRKQDFYTILIIGLDKGVNTDTVIVASYDGVNKEANLISIPRDSLVNVKRNVKKINGAYPAGTLYGGGMEGGINQLKREMKTIIGFIPDFYVCVDLKAFVKLIDMVDGVTVDVPITMKYDDPTQNLHIDIKKGEQVLNGENALKFARYRQSNPGYQAVTDYQRIKNQHTVIKAFADKLISPANILKIPDFIGVFNDNVSSDLKTENMLWFADQLNKLKGTDALSTYTLPTLGTSGLPMYYEYLDEAGIIELVNSTVNPFTKNITEKDIDIIKE